MRPTPGKEFTGINKNLMHDVKNFNTIARSHQVVFTDTYLATDTHPEKVRQDQSIFVTKDKLNAFNNDTRKLD